MSNKYIFFLKSLNIVLCENIKYKINKDNVKYIDNITKKLSKLDIIYIKIFQSLATNRDIFTKEQLDKLFLYTDKVPFTMDEIDLNELYNKIYNINNSIDNNDFDTNILINTIEYINSGMISLVYKAKLVNGKDVIIKIARKNILEKLEKSLDNICFSLKLLSKFPYISNMNIIEIFNENRELLLEQTDFKKEFNNLKIIYDKFKNIEYIKIPYVYDKFIKENILVMDFIEGKRIDKLTNNDEKNEYCKLLANFTIKSLLFDGIYHADLHAGNILFINENKKLKLGILDYGIIGHVTREEQHEYYNFFTLLSKNEKYNIKEFIINNFVEPKEVYNKLELSDYMNLSENIMNICDDVFDVYNNFEPIHIYKINKILKIYNLKLSKKFCKLQLSFAISDSICRNLAVKGVTYLDHMKVIMNQYNNILEY